MSRIFFTGLALALLAPAAAAQTASRPQATPNASSAAAQDTASLPPQEIGTITIGGTRNGLLEIGDYTMGDATWADVWYLNVTVGQRFTIDLVARQFDPYVQLLDPWGTKLAEDDDGGGHKNSRLVFTARETGRYQIVVNASGDTPRTGSYTLTVR